VISKSNELLRMFFFPHLPCVLIQFVHFSIVDFSKISIKVRRHEDNFEESLVLP